MSERSIAVTHGHCPDGSAAMAVARRIDKQTQPIYGQHEKINSQILTAVENLREGGNFWIADICCDKETLDELCVILLEKKAKLGIYEHHITRSYLKDYKLPTGLEGEIVFDTTRCGSRIFYDAKREEFSKKLADFEDFIVLINDRDLWLNKDPKSADLTMLHSMLGEVSFINRFVKNATTKFSEFEQSIVDYEKDSLNRRIHHLLGKVKILVDANDLRYGVIIGGGKASEVCNAALIKFELDYVCLVDFNNARVSLRSTEKFDCAEFSAKRGGGGHPRAAGFAISKSEFQLYEN